MQHPNSSFDLPVGYTFRPSDHDLVCHYLYNKVNGLPLPSDAVHDCDLYGSEEALDIWWMNGGLLLESRGGSLYFFSRLKKKSAEDSTICRNIGSGSWKGVGDSEEVKDKRTQKVVGWKKKFIYENVGSKYHEEWIMHEYTLDEREELDQIVACKMKRKDGAYVPNDDYFSNEEADDTDSQDSRDD